MKLCLQNDKCKLPVSGSGGTEPQIWRPGLESLNIEQLHGISSFNQMYKWQPRPQGAFSWEKCPGDEVGINGSQCLKE